MRFYSSLGQLQVKLARACLMVTIGHDSKKSVVEGVAFLRRMGGE
jgi:hypothetical protein